MELEEIRGAVARGWTSPENSKKAMDADLAEAISLEIHKLIYELQTDNDRLRNTINRLFSPLKEIHSVTEKIHRWLQEVN